MKTWITLSLLCAAVFAAAGCGTHTEPAPPPAPAASTPGAPPTSAAYQQQLKIHGGGQ